MMRMARHRFSAPRRQLGHSPHHTPGYTYTRSPAAKRRGPRPPDAPADAGAAAGGASGPSATISPDDLLAGHARQLQVAVSVPDELEVGAAEAGHAHPDEGFARSGLGHRQPRSTS